MKRFKQARLQKRLKLTEAAQLLGVTQPTLSSWESERKSPSLDALVKMAELYGVTTDYLLGREIELNADHTTPIPIEILPTLDSKPVWLPERGWALVNGPDLCFVFSDNKTLTFTEAMSPQISPEQFAETKSPKNKPLSYQDLSTHRQIWLEPISKDSELRQSLRGWYQIKDTFAENDCGNKFSLSSYGATWLAFESNE